ncbi:anthranilate n-hydroxycinnamoyl/benzoyltransferase [Apiospora arundinis]|uniref:Anthranilate n-hydroxycinnamoyl/benzoyltransferase n=1 Tax=Apiospora arundinis TaxID=335852 RepID=A0ABR2I8U6_9PEZI
MAEPLHVLNQVAPREYVNFTLCFPFNDDMAQEAVTHLQHCVDECLQQNPHLAGAIQEQDTPQRNTLAYTPQPTRVAIEQLRPSCFVSSDGSRRALTYDDIRAGGFSPGLFWGEIFAPVGNPAIVDNNLVPVLIVRTIFVKGGLLLGVFIHHAMSDGLVATALINDLAARSRGEELGSIPNGGVLPGRQQLPLGRPSAEFEERVRDLRETRGFSSEETMAALLPEWTTVTTAPDREVNFSIKNPLPANQSPRVGKIFHISKTKLQRLSQTLAGIGSKPSTNVALMALFWAYVAKARMRAVGVEDWSALQSAREKEKKVISNGNGNNHDNDMAAQAIVVAAWKPSSKSSLERKDTGANGRGGGFGPETLDAIDHFCGNMAKTPIATLPSTQLLWQAAGSSAQEEESVGTQAKKQEEALAEIAAVITRSLDTLDAEFVRQRAAMLESLADVTVMAMDHDFEAPQNVLFNSHRFLAGADTVWDIPGLLAEANNGAAGAGSNGHGNSDSGGSSRRRKPEVIRKGRKVWGQGTVLVMPSSRDSDVLEVMLAMSGTAMGELCRDEGWMGWVERVVD